MGSDLINQAQPKLQAAFDHLVDELKSIRSGRAAPSLVEDVEVEYYGQPTSLKQLANISVADGRSLTIAPWDMSALEPIEKALRATPSQDLNPVNDGKALHVNVPPLTAERREELVKQVGAQVEACYVSLRNIRHEVLNEAKRLQKDKKLSEDDYHWVDKQLTVKIDELRQRIEEVAENKREEIRTV
ncbi:ribosome recycling factor [Candidatus Microgenomates bacterium]|nr:ribosome recycling factor [Candidatus Microgenomates bacterium]